MPLRSSLGGWLAESIDTRLLTTDSARRPHRTRSESVTRPPRRGSTRYGSTVNGPPARSVPSMVLRPASRERSHRRPLAPQWPQSSPSSSSSWPPSPLSSSSPSSSSFSPPGFEHPARAMRPTLPESTIARRRFTSMTSTHSIMSVLFVWSPLRSESSAAVERVVGLSNGRSLGSKRTQQRVESVSGTYRDRITCVGLPASLPTGARPSSWARARGTPRRRTARP